MSDVASMAREWIGTPYRSQASVRGAGCDCLGLVRGVWRAVVGPEPEALPPYHPRWHETGNAGMLAEALLRHLVLVENREPAEGDVLLFRLRPGGPGLHLGIATGGERLVHAYSRFGVTESRLGSPWRRRIVSIHAFPIGA